MAQKILTDNGNYALRVRIEPGGVKNLNRVIAESRLSSAKEPDEFRKVAELFLTTSELWLLRDLVDEAL